MDAHHLAMFIFLLALFTYATTMVVEVMPRASESSYHTHVGNIRLFAGGLAAILLLSVLDPILGCIISVMWVCLFVKTTYESFQEVYRILFQVIAEARHFLSRLSGSVSVRCLGEEDPNLPLLRKIWTSSAKAYQLRRIRKKILIETNQEKIVTD